MNTVDRTAPERSPNCPVCGDARISPYARAGERSLQQCSQCMLVFYPVEPARAEMERHYSTEYFQGGEVEYADYIGEEPLHRAQGRRYLEILRKYVSLPCAILDIGCAAGFFLDEARQAGCRVIGCDISQYAVDYARREFGLEVVQGDFRDAQLSSEFDVVTAFNSFEHLPQPITVAERLENLVKPGGIVLLETWDYRSPIARLFGARWHQWHPPFVPYYYTRQTLERLFDPTRWELVEYRATAKLMSMGRGLRVLAGLSPRPVKGMMTRLADSKLQTLQIPYGMGDLVLAVLRRRG